MAGRRSAAALGVWAIAEAAAAQQGAEPHSAALGPLSDHTFLYAREDYGVQIEYLAPDGRAFLWYPGVAAVVPGRWRGAPDGDLCFSYNPQAGDGLPDAARDWRCDAWEAQWSDILSKEAGDVFDLAEGGVVPFMLRGDDYFAGFDAVRAAAASGR